MTDLAKIEAIYHAALEKTPPEREAFLREVCADDERLRREVESLLSFDVLAQDFIESPPDDLAAAFVSKRKTDDFVGREFNHYRIISALGAGGMGEVYLAEDRKLGRKVALKVLPSQFAADSERKRRFKQEARVVSALNHPNIITIYGIEETDDFDFIVTEFIDGQTLREKIGGNALGWREAIEIALQTASALEAAHSVGIVHRDIKPPNVMIRPDGYVKVLDFGLAKLLQPQTESDGFETLENTGTNRVMGTINYMSPEQALGERLDARTDIFSLGVVIYEMLSGSPPFAGSSDAAIYNATINRNPPPLCELKSEIPPALDLIVRRAIEKDRAARYQTIAELRSDLQKLKENPDLSCGNFIAPKRKTNRLKLLLPVAVAAILIGAVISLVFLKRMFAGNQIVESRNFSYAQFTNQSRDEIYPSLSPDGKNVVYASRAAGNWDIYLQRVGGENAINLTKDSLSDDTQPAYSPNGEQIAFRSNREGGGIFIMGATGENARRVSDFGFFPAWSPDGREIVLTTTTFEDPTDRSLSPAALWAVNVATGDKREITKGDAVQPAWSPGGERIAFWGLNKGGVRNIKTVSAKGGEPVAVTDDAAVDWNPVWSPDGKYLYFASNRGGSMNFWRVEIDEKSGKTLGKPEPFTVPSVFSAYLSFSANGKLLAYVQKTVSSDIERAEFDMRTETVAEKTITLTSGGRINRNPAVSPDGEWIAFDAIKDKQEDLFVMKSDGSNLRQLTNDSFNDRAPRWSADGKRLIFYSDRTGKYETWTINVDGTGLKGFSSEGDAQLAFWSPDGKRILQNFGDAYPKILSAEEKNDGTQRFVRLPPLADPKVWVMAFSWSPDGKRVAGMLQSGEYDLYGIVLYSIDSPKAEIAAEFGESPVWLSDNRRVIFFEKNKVFLLDSLTKKTKEILRLSPSENLQGISVSPDNRFIYYSLQRKETNVWLASLE